MVDLGVDDLVVDLAEAENLWLGLLFELVVGRTVAITVFSSGIELDKPGLRAMSSICAFNRVISARSFRF